MYVNKIHGNNILLYIVLVRNCMGYDVRIRRTLVHVLVDLILHVYRGHASRCKRRLPLYY